MKSTHKKLLLNSILILLLQLLPTFLFAASSPQKTAASPAKNIPTEEIKKYTSETSGNTEFLAVGRPSALKIQGKGTTATGTIELAKSSLSGELEVELKNFETGIGMRDRHMKEKYLEVEKFPKAKLKILPIALENKGEKWEMKNVDYKGLLSLHGKEKEISGKADISKDGNNISVDAKFSINIKDFSIEIPSFSGITVAENIDVNAKVNLKR